MAIFNGSKPLLKIAEDFYASERYSMKHRTSYLESAYGDELGRLKMSPEELMNEVERETCKKGTEEQCQNAKKFSREEFFPALKRMRDHLSEQEAAKD